MKQQPAAKSKTASLPRSTHLSMFDRLILLASLLFLFSFSIDPLVARLVRALHPSAFQFFSVFTDLGKAVWPLTICAAAFTGLALLARRQPTARKRIGYWHMAHMAGFIFVSVAGAGILAQLAKGLIGRARPMHLDELGPLHFEPLSFPLSFPLASFPSGHSTTAFALAASVALLRPGWRIIAYVFAGWIALSRVQIGVHYVSDIIAGALLGACFTLWLQRRLAQRRYLFEPGPQGAIRLRARHLPRRLFVPLGNSRPHRRQR